MSTEKRTHYGCGKDRRPFDYFTVRGENTYARTNFVVHGFTTHLTGVLKGQSCKVFLDSFTSRELALAIYPEAENGNDFSDPQVSVSHLPGEDDFVAGGAYPDDIEGGY